MKEDINLVGITFVENNINVNPPDRKDANYATNYTQNS